MDQMGQHPPKHGFEVSVSCAHTSLPNIMMIYGEDRCLWSMQHLQDQTSKAQASKKKGRFTITESPVQTLFDVTHLVDIWQPSISLNIGPMDSSYAIAWRYKLINQLPQVQFAVQETRDHVAIAVF